MDLLKVRQGATLPLAVTLDEDDAITATITITNDTGFVFSKSAGVTNNEADLTLTAAETAIDVGEYEYMLTVVYSDGAVEKYPDVEQCDECTLPILQICEANDIEVS